MIGYISRLTKSILVITLLTFVFGSEVAHGAVGACCLGSTCSVIDEIDCDQQDGHFLAGTFFCQAGICDTGACCTDVVCTDEGGLGGPIDESQCDDLGGWYRGGGDCANDACGFVGPPAGYEIIEITPEDLQPFENYKPKLNNCGQIVYFTRFQMFVNDTQEVFLYDNGNLQRITDNNVRDGFPDINDSGIITWHRLNPPDMEIVLYDGKTIYTIAKGNDHKLLVIPKINNLNHVVWYLSDSVPCPSVHDIVYYDGNRDKILFADGLSNQSPFINDLDQITWTNYILPCEFAQDWTSTSMLHSQGIDYALPTDFSQPVNPVINNKGQVAWSSGAVLEFWEDDLTSFVSDGDIPSLNEHGDMSFSHTSHERNEGWEVWLYRNGRFHWISPSAKEIADSNSNINNNGEVAWASHLGEGSLVPSEIRYMRWIRTGDVDQDFDVDREDLGYFTNCYTGPVATDGLCECRFLDIDHDRDVDDDDFALFLNNFTDEPLDCMNRTVQEVYDGLLAGTLTDCNANGNVDECDISEGLIADANSNNIPDNCDCPIVNGVGFEPLNIPKSRFLSIDTGGPSIPGVPGNPGIQSAIRVTLMDINGFESFNGEVRWVGEPVQYCEGGACANQFWGAQLQCEPHYRDWSDLGLLHLTGDSVVPQSTYEVQVVQQGCASLVGDGLAYSVPFEMITSKWGDVSAPYYYEGGPSQPSIADVLKLVDKWLGSLEPIKSRAQLQPSVLNISSSVGIADVLKGVDAWLGTPYPFAGPTACP